MPLILRLFPDARCVDCLRHPCDVILSSYMQYFSLTPAMANFLDFDDTVACYREVMSVWRRYEKHFAPHMSALQPFIEAFGYAK